MKGGHPMVKKSGQGKPRRKRGTIVILLLGIQIVIAYFVGPYLVNVIHEIEMNPATLMGFVTFQDQRSIPSLIALLVFVAIPGVLMA